MNPAKISKGMMPARTIDKTWEPNRNATRNAVTTVMKFWYIL